MKGAEGKRRCERSRGSALIETVVAGTLLLLVVQVVWWVAGVQSALASRIVEEARIRDDTRLIEHLLATEIGQGQAAEDWSIEGETLRLRAFRGIGLSCRTQPNAGWGVAVSGHRSPDPDKDSVMVFSGDGGWRVSRLVRRARTGGLDCQGIPGFSTEVWTLDPARPGAVAGTYFEPGSYQFSSGAFRYRPGNGRWQPLTSVGIVVDSTGFATEGTDGFTARIVWDDPRGIQSRGFSRTVWGSR